MKYANAAVMNFCPDGVLGLATGVVYQSTRSPSVQIGASDGLSIYRGTWTRTDQGVAVEYKLVSAEFMNLLDDPVASAKRTAALKLKRPGLEFPFTSHRGKIYRFEFIPAARYEKQVIDEWVACETGQVRRRSSATSPKDSW